MNDFSLNDDSNITIPIRNLIALLVTTAIAVMGYFDLTQRISMLEREYAILESFVRQNNEFRIMWPRGELGSLPDDAEQNIRLDFMDKKLITIEEKLEKEDQ